MFVTIVCRKHIGEQHRDNVRVQGKVSSVSHLGPAQWAPGLWCPPLLTGVNPTPRLDPLVSLGTHGANACSLQPLAGATSVMVLDNLNGCQWQTL